MNRSASGPVSGLLSQTPFPRLLWDLAGRNASGVLKVKRGEASKRIFFDSGHPVHAESNLLHETLGKFLIEEKAITTTQEEEALIKALETSKPLHEVLVETGAVDGAKLYEHLRKSFALKILDCFSWDKGSYSFEEGEGFLEGILALRMNPERLVVRGVETVFPQASIDADLGPAERFSVTSNAGVDAGALQLSAEEIGLLRHLKNGRTIADISSELGVDAAKLRRRAYALNILGLIEPAGGEEGASLDDLVGAALLASLKPMEPPPPPIEAADPKVRILADSIAADHMRLTSLNYFELLGLPETATAVTVRDRFLDFAAKYNPDRFRRGELGEFRDRAEEIFLRGVKAFSVLFEFASKDKYLDKLKAERSRAAETGRKKPGEAFKIETKLLDAKPQFDKGAQLLREGKFDSAAEFFSYAADIDGRSGKYLAHLGWARFQSAPSRNAKEAEALLRRARDMGSDAHAALFLGRFLLERGERDEALGHLRAAADMAPKDIEIVRALRSAEKK